MNYVNKTWRTIPDGITFLVCKYFVKQSRMTQIDAAVCNEKNCFMSRENVIRNYLLKKNEKKYFLNCICIIHDSVTVHRVC